MSSVEHAPTCPVSQPGFVPNLSPGAPQQCNCDFAQRFGDAVGKRVYMPLPIRCDMSRYSLSEAAMVVGAAFTYELYVHPSEEVAAIYELKQLAAQTLDNPMAPYVNLHTDQRLDREEWVLEANGRACGSKGA